MATRPDTIRYQNGVVEIDDREVVFRKSPRLFLGSQVELWRTGRPTNRIEAVLRTLFAVLLPVATLYYFYLAFVSDVWWATGLYRQVQWTGTGLLFVFSTWETFFRSIRVPLDRLDDGVRVESDRSLRFSRDAFGWYDRFKAWGTGGLKVTFPGQAHRDRAAALLDREGDGIVSVDPDRRAARAVYKFFEDGGGYFCPACDTRVSPRDASCSECDEDLTAETHSRAENQSSEHPGADL
jgi:hypothetical protein